MGTDQVEDIEWKGQNGKGTECKEDIRRVQNGKEKGTHRMSRIRQNDRMGRRWGQR